MLRKATNKDCDLILQYANKEPELNLFIIGDIEEYGINDDPVTVYYSLKEDKIKFIFLKYHNNYVFYSEKQDYDFDDYMFLEEKYQIPLISMGEKDFQFIYSKLSNKYDYKECIMSRLTQIEDVNYQFKSTKATKEDAANITKSLQLIKEFEIGNQLPIDERTKQIAKSIKDGVHQHYIIYKDGKVIANANTSTISSNAAMVGGVFTLTEYRNQGYAFDCVYSLCKELLCSNKKPLLFYENPVAAKLYHKIGFIDFNKWYILHCKKN